MTRIQDLKREGGVKELALYSDDAPKGCQGFARHGGLMKNPRIPGS